MKENERILMECRYLLSLNKTYNDLALIFNISEREVYCDLNVRLAKLDTILFKRVQNVLDNKKST